MTRTRVKICGITSPDDAQAAASAGADSIGVVFWYGSARCVSVHQGRAIADSVSPAVVVVGVFLDPDIETVMRTVRSAGLSAAQLCGTLADGPWMQLAHSIPLIRAVSCTDQRGMIRDRGLAFGDYLLDSAGKANPGGTGKSFDWSIAKTASGWGRIWLAGGLNPVNVGDAIVAVHPFAVDVSTGVEQSPGVKSHDAIRAFVKAVRTVDGAINPGGSE